MKIFNEHIYLEAFEDCIMINGKQFYDDIFSIVGKLKEVTKGILWLNIDRVNYDLSENEIILLLGIANNIETLHCVEDNNDYEITFSYHFPLFYESKFIEILLNNFNSIVYGNVVNLATKGEFVRVDVSNINEYKLFYDKHGYWLRHNNKILNMQVNNLKLNETLDNWNLYCKSKFGKEFSRESINAYKKIYSLPGFYVIEHMNKNIVVAQGVVYLSKQTNTLYYCIFWWDNKCKALSPGKYNYSKTIEFCHQNNLSFSFCYGFQKYKFELIKFFKYSNAQEWTKLC